MIYIGYSQIEYLFVLQRRRRRRSFFEEVSQ